MLELLKYILLGLVQGVAEVLPISSSAHLIIVQELMGINNDTLTFEVLLHLASLIAILAFLWKKLWQLIKGFCYYVFKKNKEYEKDFKYVILLILSTIPAVIFALLFKDVINLLASKLWVVGLLLIINGCILLTITRIVGFRKREELNYKDALVIGCFQCLGILPGISRSGSCLSGAFTRKIEKETAADYAFLLFIPAVLGATVLELENLGSLSGETNNLIYYIVGFIVAMITTYFSFKFLLAVIKKGKLSWFGYYCLAIGVGVLIQQIITKM
ncbi:MAG TPA: undecaprenyl-diphosphate phosphatase [Bacilli bacterium]|nr:undecaprenyl-diphosphate phosphatase [Bacilli bacterium]